MNKNILVTMFFVLIVVFSVSAIQAKDINSTVVSVGDNETIAVDDAHQLTDLGSDLSDDSSFSDVKNQSELNSPSTSIYYQGDYRVVLKDSSSNAPLPNKKVNFVIDNVNYSSISDNEGAVSLNLKLNPGKYNVFASFDGDSDYESTNLTSILSILPTIKAADVSKYYKGGTTYTATFYDSHGKALANRNVAISVNGKVYTKKTNNKGVVSLAVNLKPGSYKIVSTDPITGYRLTTTFNILSTISSSNLKKVAGDSRKFTVKFFKSNGKALAKKYVKIKFKGKTKKYKTNSAGKVTLNVKKLKKGTYKVICYNKDGLSKTYTINVFNRKASTKLTTSSYTFYTNQTKQIKVKLSTALADSSNVGKVIKISIGGKTYSKKTDGNGAVCLQLPALNKGLYKVQYTYAGTKFFKKSTSTGYVTVLNTKSTEITPKGTTHFGYGAGTSLKVLYSAGGVPLIKKSVTLNVGGNTYVETTDNNGLVYLPINLNIGNYAVSYQTSDDSKVYGTSGSFDIDVFKRSASKVTWKSGTSFKDDLQTFKVFVSDLNGKAISGKTVELTIDGETYDATTASNGYATFKTRVAIGTYKVSFRFEGSNDCLPGQSSKNVKVTLSMFKNGINQKNTLSNLKAYLKSSSHCQVGNKKIKKLVKSLTKGLKTKEDKAKAIFNYVRDTLGYSYYYNTHHGAAGTLKLKKGNCVDHSHLLVAMFRTAGLHARYVHGVCKFSDSGTTGHVWTQVLIGKHWVCADATSYRNSLGKIKNWNTKSYKIHAKYASLPF